jgi:hypothetical protein
MTIHKVSVIQENTRPVLRKKPIPDPGVKKASDVGFGYAILQKTPFFLHPNLQFAVLEV